MVNTFAHRKLWSIKWSLSKLNLGNPRFALEAGRLEQSLTAVSNVQFKTCINKIICLTWCNGGAFVQVNVEYLDYFSEKYVLSELTDSHQLFFVP